MAHPSSSVRLSADIRAKARHYEATVAAAHMRRRQVVVAALCVAVVVAGGAGGAWLARVSTEVAAGVPPGRVQIAQALGPEFGVSDAGDVGVGIETNETTLARLYEEPLARAPETDPRDPGDPQGAATLARVSFPTLKDLGRVPPSPPLWQRYAVPVADPGDRPMIAIVIDDLGLSHSRAYRTIDLPAPLTLAFMTYAEGLPEMAGAAHQAGHELMLHVPMQPRSRSYDPGPNVLATDLPPDEVVRRLEWGLGRFDGFVGINNHMGSRFTASPEGMAYVMRELRGRGLLFLDSLTAGNSVGRQAAESAGVPYAVRDIFLDDTPNDAAAVRRQLDKLEAVARRRGYAVGIGHPHRETLDVLAEWLPQARRRGFVLVPISAIVRHRVGIIQAAAKTTD